MALYYDLPVFKDTYSLTLKVFELTKNFSREYKFTLGQDMKRDCINLVRSIYRANKTKVKEVYLEQFLDEFQQWQSEQQQQEQYKHSPCRAGFYTKTKQKSRMLFCQAAPEFYILGQPSFFNLPCSLNYSMIPYRSKTYLTLIINAEKTNVTVREGCSLNLILKKI